MQKIIINTDGLKESEIEESAIRTKALIINSSNQLLLGYGFNAYQFIGGHVKDEEKLEDCLIREIEEETGIKIKTKGLKPFMEIVHYTRNYRNSGRNRENIIFYYIIYTDDEINLNNLNYDEWERKGNFEVRKVLIDDVEDVLIESIPDNEMNKLIVDEMIEVLNHYKKTIK